MLSPERIKELGDAQPCKVEVQENVIPLCIVRQYLKRKGISYLQMGENTELYNIQSSIIKIKRHAKRN